MNNIYESVWKSAWFCVGIFVALIKTSDAMPIGDGRYNLTGEEYDPEDAMYALPMNIEDGQSITDKLRVMRALARIEKRMEEIHGLRQSDRRAANVVNYVYEMDIILTPRQAEKIYEHSKFRQKRKMSANLTSLWKLPIYYYFDGSHSPYEQLIIEDAIAYWESLTCIKFRKSNGTVSWEQGNQNNVTVEIRRNTGCWSYVGKKENANGIQRVSIDSGCLYKGRISHELGHVIGFWHEHARPDRDDHVTIKWQNIMDHKQGNFEVSSWQEITDKGIPYDVGSVMHYGSTAFSKAGNATVVTKIQNLQRALGQRHGLSFYDVKLANLVYCSDVCAGIQLAQPCKNGGYQDPKKCTTCRCAEGLSGDFCEISAPSVGVSCGGEVNITQTPITIEYMLGFLSGYQCNWYLKAPEGMNVHFELIGDFVNFDTCYKDKYVTCDSYLEVRYSADLANTGARFCCSYKEEGGPMISEGNEMVVLLRGHNNGTVGFQANVWAEPCGGCSASNSTDNGSYRPCYKRIPQTCIKTWREKKFTRCQNGWFSKSKSDNCNKWIFTNMSREETCHVTVPTCCNNFHLNGNWCTATSMLDDDAMFSFTVSGTPSISNDDMPNVVQKDAVAWSTWSACSQTCGGCGFRTRHRICANPESCGTGDDNEETEACPNQPPCVTSIMTTCAQRVMKKDYCNGLTTATCTKYFLKTRTCPLIKCCEGYVQQGNICILANN